VSSVADLTTMEAYAFMKSGGKQYIGTSSIGASLKYDSSTKKVSVLSGAAHWPEDGSALNFYAFSPNSDECMKDKSVTNSGISFTMNMPADKAKDTDILFAKCTSVKETTYSGNVPLKFEHLLCRIHFTSSVRFLESNLEVFPKRIVLKNIPTECTYKTTNFKSWNVSQVSASDSLVLYEGDGTESLYDVWNKIRLEGINGGPLDRQFMPGKYTIEMQCHARVTYLTDDGIGPTWVVGDEDEYETRSYDFDISQKHVGYKVWLSVYVRYFGIPNLEFTIKASSQASANRATEVDLGTKTL